MSEALIRAQIKAILEGVSGIGVVHSRKRLSLSLANFLELMSSGSGSEKKVNGCMIVPGNCLATLSTVDLVDAPHNYQIILIYKFEDEENSTDPYQALCELIRKTLTANKTLNGTAWDTTPTKWTINDIEELAGVSYHWAEFELTATEQEIY